MRKSGCGVAGMAFSLMHEKNHYFELPIFIAYISSQQSDRTAKTPETYPQTIKEKPVAKKISRKKIEQYDRSDKEENEQSSGGTGYTVS